MLAVFDRHAVFEIIDQALLEVVSAGKVETGPTPEADSLCVGVNSECGNKSCYNEGCDNEWCFGNSNDVFC